ncbi:hypothetical protein CVU83_02295 [Candidatus Falkowbacteria bacterium HGW-Falkowbacteria-2]|uniref:Uncharacterized protein n=1 Tax=Candidatus Falkowbacteria bacterium HGW-Falkowbacteria-2 TaxID=2013769 RepID=A0A2N2DZU3_9BACT|nr:MAG: hypothetical protein CVU83_02295 [Candidatus Falkowbacteria bacterium HGW-Falkowbacteria-2]
MQSYVDHLEKNLKEKNWGEVWRLIRQEIICNGQSIASLSTEDKERLKEVLKQALEFSKSEQETIVRQLNQDITKVIADWFS